MEAEKIIEKRMICKKCLEPILADQDQVEISNFLIKAIYHVACYKQNKKNIKWLIIGSYVMPFIIFLFFIAIMIGIFFGVIEPKMHH